MHLPAGSQTPSQGQVDSDENRPDRFSVRNAAGEPPPAPDRGEAQTVRRRIYEVLEVAQRHDRSSRLCDNFLIFFIAANIVAVVVETVGSIQRDYNSFFVSLEVISVAIFSVEYCLRVWSCVDGDELQNGGALRTRIRHMMTPMAVIDLLAILPFYLSFIVGIDLRFLRVLRLLRVLKLTRYSPALNLLLNVLREETNTFLAAFFVLVVLLILSASGIFIFEHAAQPTAFGSIPAAMWWAMSTLTTVGYGDVTPITVGGKIFGSLITVIGIGTAALPAGILASGFVNQVSRRRKAMGREIDKAFADGLIDGKEEKMIEESRRQLGVSDGLADDVRAERLDALSGQLAKGLATAIPPQYCPHCGTNIWRPEQPESTAPK